MLKKQFIIISPDTRCKKMVKKRADKVQQTESLTALSFLGFMRFWVSTKFYKNEIK
jgi:hypothetical protein